MFDDNKNATCTCIYLSAVTDVGCGEEEVGEGGGILPVQISQC